MRSLKHWSFVVIVSISGSTAFHLYNKSGSGLVYHNHNTNLRPNPDMKKITSNDKIVSFRNIRTSLHSDSDSNKLVSSGEVSSNKQVLGIAAAGLYSAVSIVAGTLSLTDIGADLFGFLNDFTFVEYGRDMGSSLLCAVLGTVWVKVWTSATKNNLITPVFSRKIIHTTSAPLFMLFWPLFSSSDYARFFAGVVPALNAFKLFLAGSDREGGDKELANAVSRSGDIKEALGGPFLYTIILFSATVISWRTSLPGIVAVSTMAAGDGMADIIGRRFGKTNKWFFSESKSIAGSIAFCLSAFLVSMALILWLDFSTGGIDAITGMGLESISTRIGVISILCTAIELVPGADDNWTVPLAAALLTQFLFLV